MTHYEVLGVDPGAGIDEIRAAYRARARELHPDRRGVHADPHTDKPHTGKPHTEKQSAGPEMAAVNQAWAVLGDPARRSAYDAWLKTGVSNPGPKTWPGTGATTARVVETQPRYDEDHPPPVHSAMPGCIGSGALPWLALVIVLIVIFIFTAYAGPSDEDGPAGGSATSEAPDQPEVSLKPVRDIRGMCIRVAGGITSPVDCFTQPNEGRIVAQASIGASCPPGTNEWLVRQLDTLACTEAGSTAAP